MKIALIGYGKMGKEIEKIALKRGHEIVSIIDDKSVDEFDTPRFASADVAIEFTTPATAYDNFMKAFDNNIPVVSGTTGWLDRLSEIKEICKNDGKTFFYASNFSLGVNIFFAVNEYLAKIMNQFTDYEVSMEEIHHIHKLDAPSGTGITLAEGILQNIDRKSKWSLDKATLSTDLVINSLREGEVPGIHEVFYESDADIISIKHDAKNRKGFALGAVLAAEFSHDKKGFLGMKDMLKF